MKWSKWLLVVTLLIAAVLSCGAGCPQTYPWDVRQRNNIVEICYGSGTNYPQYAALDVASSYFRLICPGTNWGTSVILLPSFWSQGINYQHAPISYDWGITEGDVLNIFFSGEISTLVVDGCVRISPPESDKIRAEVSVTTQGTVTLDERPGEAFKPVMLSSMHVSADQWDCLSAYIDGQSYSIPQQGWIIWPSVTGNVFGLAGGTSEWKENAPTIEVALPESMAITGWVTFSSDPNDDNIGFWPATDEVLSNWHYTLVASPKVKGR